MSEHEHGTRYQTLIHLPVVTPAENIPEVLPTSEVEFVDWVFQYVPQLEAKGFRKVVIFDSKEEAGFIQNSEGEYPMFHSIPIGFTKDVNWLGGGEFYQKDGASQEEMSEFLSSLPASTIEEFSDIGRLEAASPVQMKQGLVLEKYCLEPPKFVNFRNHKDLYCWVYRKGTYLTDFHTELCGDASIARTMAGKKLWLFLYLISLRVVSRVNTGIGGEFCRY